MPVARRCWHVMRHLGPIGCVSRWSLSGLRSTTAVIRRGIHAMRRAHPHGFTTDLTRHRRRPHLSTVPSGIPASRVLFVPQQETSDPIRGLGWARTGLRVEVRTTRRAEFFVFNDGDDPSGVRVLLVPSVCGRQVELDKQRAARAHTTPLGRDCPGKRFYDTGPTWDTTSEVALRG